MKYYFLFGFMLLSLIGEAQDVNRVSEKSETKHRRIINIDYRSWFENIHVVQSSGSYDSRALIYGLGVHYEAITYYPTWGFGAEGGYIQGYGVVGDVNNTTNYYTRRAPMSTFRFGLRLFEKQSQRFEIGLANDVLYKNQAWPTVAGSTVTSSGAFMIGVFLDTRWRLNKGWDIINAFGTYSKGPSLAWRLGVSYSL